MADPETKAEHRKGKKTAQSHYDPYNLNVPVVVVTSEVAPYSKRLGPVSCHARSQSLPGFCSAAKSQDRRSWHGGRILRF